MIRSPALDELIVKTFLPTIDVQRRAWRIVDADGHVLGRLAEKIANVLRGRDKPTFTPHLDGGEFVIVINAEKIRVTGKKETDKIYSSYSGYRGGLKQVPLADIRAKHPERLIMKAVKGMLPKNRLAAKLLTKLKVYAGSDHPHGAQNPEPLISTSK